MLVNILEARPRPAVVPSDQTGAPDEREAGARRDGEAEISAEPSYDQDGAVDVRHVLFGAYLCLWVALHGVRS